MRKTLTAGLLAFSFLFATAAPALANSGDGQQNSGSSVSNIATTKNAALKICYKNAQDTRNQALKQAKDTRDQALKNAQDKYQAALKAAKLLNDKSAAKAQVKQARVDMLKEKKAARDAYKQALTQANTAYRDAKKACRDKLK